MSRWLSISLAVGCALSVAAACSNGNPKKKPIGDAGGAYEGGAGASATGGSGGMDAGPDVVDAAQDVVDARPEADAEAEAAPAPPPLFFSVSPGAIGQPGSGVAQQTSPQSAVYGTTTAASAPSAGSNMLVVPASELGLDPLDDIDAVSVKKPLPVHPFYYFSVDDSPHTNVGTDVALAASRYTQRGDVFLSDGIPYNNGEGTQGFDGLYSTGLSVGLGQHPAPAGAGDAGADAGVDAAMDAGDAGAALVDDNLDALEIGVTAANAGTAYFSVDPGASGAPGSKLASTPPDERGCTIYASDRDGQNRVVYSCAQIGLVPGDNVDALAVFDTGTTTRVYFSVDATSVGAANTDVYTQTQSQYNPYRSDIFYSDGDGTNHLAVDATGFALDYESDVDALAIVDDPRSPLYVPTGSDCKLAPSPVYPVDGGISYNYYVAGNISGSLELFYVESAAAGDQYGAYDLASCLRVGSAMAGAYTFTGGDLVPVPRAKWSALQPLSNLDVWDIFYSGQSIHLKRIDLATGQTLAEYTSAANFYLSGWRAIYLPGTKQFAIVSDEAIVLIDVPTGGTADGGVVTLPPSTPIERYCSGIGQALGSDPSGFIELATVSAPFMTPLETLDCRLRLDGYPAQPYRPWDQGSLGSIGGGGVIIPDQAMYLFERQNNDIQVHVFEPPLAAVDGGTSDGGGG